MVKNHHHNHGNGFARPGAAIAARQVRGQADCLLRQLEARSRSSQQRFAELGQRDAIKFVTGRTALEDAIATTQAMIRDMDALLDQMNGELESFEAKPGALPVGEGQ